MWNLLFDTLMEFLKEFFEKTNRRQKKVFGISQHSKSQSARQNILQQEFCWKFLQNHKYPSDIRSCQIKLWHFVEILIINPPASDILRLLLITFENSLHPGWSGSKLSDTLLIFLKEFFEKVNRPQKIMIFVNSLLLGNFSCFRCRLLTFFEIYFFKKFFQEHYKSVKWFGSRSGPTFCWSWSGSNCLQRLSADNKSCSARKVPSVITLYWYRGSFQTFWLKAELYETVLAWHSNLSNDSKNL